LYFHLPASEKSFPPTILPMRAVLCSEYGKPDLLSLKQIADPIPTENEVLIKVATCGVNFPDLLLIQQLYQFQPPLPFSPGGEAAGTIVSVGKAVQHFKTGDRVLAISGWGGFAELVTADQNQVIHLPPEIDFSLAAASAYQYGTSLYALKNLAQLQPGETLLVLGAGSGVGLAAVELGSQMGAVVIAAASTEAKLTACKQKGAQYTLLTNEPLKPTQISAVIPGGKAAVVFDPVGGQLAGAALRVLQWKGRYLVVGFAAGEIPSLPLNLPLLKGFSVHGVFWGSFIQQEPTAHRENMQQIFDWLIQKKIEPLIHGTYALEHAALALEHLQKRQVIGKALIDICLAAPHVAPTKKEASLSTNPPSLDQPVGTTGHLKDLQQLIGKQLGPGEWLTITAPMIQEFAKLTGDDQWIHVDTERAAKELPGGRIIAHGFFTLSLIIQQLYQLIDSSSVKKMLNYGTNKVRFITPVEAGKRVRLHATIAHTEPGKQGGTLLFIQCSMEVEHAEKPACAAELVSLIFT
jgi:NADPH:quinone reductase-like Zn-dependent oxidoreductase/acyl dehydratase